MSRQTWLRTKIYALMFVMSEQGHVFLVKTSRCAIRELLFVMRRRNLLVHYLEKKKLLCIPSSYSELIALNADI